VITAILRRSFMGGPADHGGGAAGVPQQPDLNRLRRENRQLRLEREILSKAAAWFAREMNTIPPTGSGS
jgi:transposase-like protein